MILIGRYRSPFSRRVAVTLRLLGIPYEHRAQTTWSDLADVRSVNPVGRVPALVLDDDDVLVDSTAILDHLDQIAGPGRALVPVEEPLRRRTFKVTMTAFGGLEKVVAALYERTLRPVEVFHRPWFDHNVEQACNAFAWLDTLDAAPWLMGERMTQADVTTAVTVDFTRLAVPEVMPPGRYPRLDALAARCAELPAFRETRPGSDVPDSPPILPP